MAAHKEIPKGNHNHLGTLEGNLKDESKNNTVDWSSSPIYGDYLDEIQEINQIEVLEEGETNDFPIKLALMFEKLKEEIMKSEFVYETYNFSKYRRLKNIRFIGSNMSHSYLLNMLVMI